MEVVVMSARILCGIYQIRNTLNGKVYVGATTNLTERWRLHRFHLNSMPELAEAILRVVKSFAAVLAIAILVVAALEIYQDLSEPPPFIHFERGQ
jgi:GIY-YIG catalytic domain